MLYLKSMIPKNFNQVISPQSDLLKKYVANFYILNDFEQESAGIAYYAFPQSGTDVSFFKNTRVKIGKNRVEFKKDLNEEPKIIFLGKYLTPLKVNYKSHVHKMTIHFTETGVFNFFPNYYSTYGKNIMQPYALKDFDIDPERLFSKDVKESIQYLESYLLHLFSPKSHPKIERAVEILKEDLSIPSMQLAEQVGMNFKTFGRKFKSHVGCTTSEFKRITRFKRTARNYFDGGHENLAQLCYDNGYYDASDFYRQIRKTTRLKPKEFFKNVKRVGPKHGIYIFE